MQLQFTSEEFQVLADLIEERDEALRVEIARTSDIDTRRTLEEERAVLNTLEDQILERDLHFTAEELDTLGNLVARYQQTFAQEGALSAATDQQRRRLELLRQIRDRLAETCAMF